MWGVSLPLLEALHPLTRLGAPLCCCCTGIPDTQASVPLAQCLGRCPYSARWLPLDLGSRLKCPLLGRSSLMPGILCWPVLSFVLCPSTGLSSVRTSSPHLVPAAPPAPRPGPVCSLHPPQDKAEAPAARPRSSYARKALSQPQGGFPPAWPSAPRSPCLKFCRSTPCSGLSRTLTERLSVWAPGRAWGARAPPGLENSVWERRLERQGTSPVAAEVCHDRAEAGAGGGSPVVPGHTEGGLGLGLGLGHLGGVPDLGTPVLRDVCMSLRLAPLLVPKATQESLLPPQRPWSPSSCDRHSPCAPHQLLFHAHFLFQAL